VLEPIAVALDRLQGDRSCFYGSLLPTLLAIEKKLKRLKTSHVLHHVHAILAAVISGLEKRFGDFLQLNCSKNDAILATTSNPKFKLKWLTINPELNTEKSVQSYREMLIAAVRKECQAREKTSQEIDSPEGSSTDEFFDFESLPSTLATSPNRDSPEIEVLQYLSDASHSLESLDRYPSVKKVFLKYNTALPSSAPVERLFSFAGHIHSPKRSKLSDSMFENLVMLKGNSTYL